ncbi:MAG: hypothetical protein U0271_33550 [Polyangiaceae bacterium]
MFNQDFSDFLVALVDHEVEFALIGGWALAVYGHVRGTDDLDVIVNPTPQNAARVIAALRSFGAPLAQHRVTEALFEAPGYGYRMGVKPNLIELLTTISGVSFEQVMKDHRTVEVDGRLVPVIGRGAFIDNKRASGRAKDLADLEWLLGRGQ